MDTKTWSVTLRPGKEERTRNVPKLRAIVVLVGLFMIPLQCGHLIAQQTQDRSHSTLSLASAWEEIRAFYCEGDSVGIWGCGLESPEGFTVVRQTDSVCAGVIGTDFVASPWLWVEDELVLATFRLATERWDLQPSPELEKLRESVTYWNKRHAEDIKRLEREGLTEESAAMLLRAKRDLARLAAAQEFYWAKHSSYTPDTTQLHWRASPQVSLTITYAGEYGWRAQATHNAAAEGMCRMWYGVVPDTTPGSNEGIAECYTTHRQ